MFVIDNICAFTEGVQNNPQLQIPVLGSIIKVVLNRTFDTPAVGAYTSLFAAAFPAVKAEHDKYKGAFLWPPGKVVEPPAPQVDDKELAEDLVNTTETLLKEWGV